MDWKKLFVLNSFLQLITNILRSHDLQCLDFQLIHEEEEEERTAATSSCKDNTSTSKQTNQITTHYIEA